MIPPSASRWPSPRHRPAPSSTWERRCTAGRPPPTSIRRCSATRPPDPGTATGGSGGDIVVQPLADDLRSFADETTPELLLRGWSADPQLPFEHGIEGPFLVERDGWYHLWYSGDRTWTYPPNYATMVARSRSPLGPFQRREDGGSVIVLRDNERWRGPGHNSVVRDDSGADWVVYHAIDSREPWLYEGQVRRVMLIDRIEYVDGWPVVGDGTPSTAELQGPVSA